MGKALRVGNAELAKEIAVEAAKELWRYTVPRSFIKAEHNENDQSWDLQVDYFEVKLTFKIDAVTGNVSKFACTRCKTRRKLRSVK
jgi:hypothetical protein